MGGFQGFGVSVPGDYSTLTPDMDYKTASPSTAALQNRPLPSMNSKMWWIVGGSAIVVLGVLFAMSRKPRGLSGHNRRRRSRRY